MSAGTIATSRRFDNQLPVAVPMMVFSVMLGDVVLTDVPAIDFIGAMQAIFLIFLASQWWVLFVRSRRKRNNCEGNINKFAGRPKYLRPVFLRKKRKQEMCKKTGDYCPYSSPSRLTVKWNPDSISRSTAASSQTMAGCCRTSRKTTAPSGMVGFIGASTSFWITSRVGSRLFA